MRTVVGLYDQFEDAQQVVHALRDAGFSREDISLISHDNQGQYSRYLQENTNTTTSSSAKGDSPAEGAAAGAGIGAVLGGLGGLLLGLGALAIPGIGPVIAAGPIAAALAGAGIGAVAGGLVGALVDMGIPEEHAKLYSEGVRRGGTLVVVRAQDEMADQAVDIMNHYNPVDINQRSTMWQGGQDTSTYDTTMSSDRNSRDFADDEEMDFEQVRNHDTTVPVTGNDVTDDVSIPVVEEDLRVGKREVDRGGVRINTYTSERPVEEDIDLRQEHVNVERRPVDRPATDEDFNSFQEGTIEMRETGEEPVVEKRARVVEEVHVNKDVENTKETIRDSVRRKDVDVEQIGAQDTGTRGMGSMSWDDYDQMFRQDYQSRYGTTGQNYNYYLPAYRYGYDLASDPRYNNSDWSQVEQQARSDWERRGGQGAWSDIRDSVRYAWDKVRGRA